MKSKIFPMTCISLQGQFPFLWLYTTFPFGGYSYHTSLFSTLSILLTHTGIIPVSWRSLLPAPSPGPHKGTPSPVSSQPSGLLYHDTIPVVTLNVLFPYLSNVPQLVLLQAIGGQEWCVCLHTTLTLASKPGTGECMDYIYRGPPVSQAPCLMSCHVNSPITLDPFP